MRLLCSCLFIFLVASFVSAEPPATTQPATRRSLSGPVVSGIQARLQSLIDVEQNAALPVTLEIQCDPDLLPAGIARLNTFLYRVHCQLRMVNASSGKQFKTEPYDPTLGMITTDDGKTFGRAGW
jgi:hypothetical protein